jgi:CRP-like cAMP-binding protein
METLFVGDSFGDIALLHDSKRSATAVAKDYSMVLRKKKIQGDYLLHF